MGQQWRWQNLACVLYGAVLTLGWATAWTNINNNNRLTRFPLNRGSRFLRLSALSVGADNSSATDTIINYNNIDDENWDQGWEDIARQMATKALEPVLSSWSSLPNKNATLSTTSITAEQALRKTLRSLPENSDEGIRRFLRKRLADLILGTSVMRLRHDFIYNQSQTLPSSISKLSRIRGLVDLHATFMLQSNHNQDDQELGNHIIWPKLDAERISVQHSMPLFLVQTWMDQYGIHETEELCRIANAPGPVTLRRNQLRCSSDDEFCQRLAQDGVDVIPLANVYQDKYNHRDHATCITPPFWKPPVGCFRLVSRPANQSIWSMPSWKEGWFEVQDVGSQLIVAAMEVKAGETVIDYCAGNGGKTLALLSSTATMNMDDGKTTKKDAKTGNAVLWAHDIVESRLAQLRGSLDRVLVGAHQTSQIVVTTTSHHSDLTMANVVLVDAPCSSCGVLRRRPSHRWDMTSNMDVDEPMSLLREYYPTLQLEILQRASTLVHPGNVDDDDDNCGRLVYATCSISQWENQNVVRLWEQTHASQGDDDCVWEKWDFDERQWPSQENMPSHCRQLLPHQHDSDGYFLARWKRRRRRL